MYFCICIIAGNTIIQFLPFTPLIRLLAFGTGKKLYPDLFALCRFADRRKITEVPGSGCL